MNVRLIAKALHALSLLTDDDLDLLMKLRELNESEREALVGVLEPAKPAKRAKRPPVKSKKASSLAEQIKVPLRHPGAMVPVTPACTACGYDKDYEDHSQPSPRYHPFAPPARSAAASSSRETPAAESTASSGESEASAGVVAHAVGGD